MGIVCHCSGNSVCAGVKNLRSEEDMKVKEKARENLRIKGAFTAQELYDGHRGINFFYILNLPSNIHGPGGPGSYAL